MKNIATSSDNDAEKYLEITRTDIYNGFPKLKSAFGFWSDNMF